MLGNTLGNVFLIDSAIAITVCTLAVVTACDPDAVLDGAGRAAAVRLGRSPASAGRAKVPIVPALFVGVCSIVLLVLNIANQSAFLTLTSVAIIMFYIAVPRRHGLDAARCGCAASGRGRSTGPTSTSGRWGLLVNWIAVIYGVLVTINIALAARRRLRRGPALVLQVVGAPIHRRCDLHHRDASTTSRSR